MNHSLKLYVYIEPEGMVIWGEGVQGGTSA